MAAGSQHCLQLLHQHRLFSLKPLACRPEPGISTAYSKNDYYYGTTTYTLADNASHMH